MSVRVDSPDLRALLVDLRQVDKKLAASLRKELKALAEPLRRAVAAEASWSSRIPGAVKAQVKATKRSSAVLVAVDRKKAPHARPLEGGSRRNRGVNRHPVFQREGRPVVRVNQPTRPFFGPAIQRSSGRIDAAVLQVAKDFETKLGFK